MKTLLGIFHTLIKIELEKIREVYISYKYTIYIYIKIAIIYHGVHYLRFTNPNKMVKPHPFCLFLNTKSTPVSTADV